MTAIDDSYCAYVLLFVLESLVWYQMHTCVQFYSKILYISKMVKEYVSVAFLLEVNVGLNLMYFVCLFQTVPDLCYSEQDYILSTPTWEEFRKTPKSSWVNKYIMSWHCYDNYITVIDIIFYSTVN